jgi:hypothetical protein
MYVSGSAFYTVRMFLRVLLVAVTAVSYRRLLMMVRQAACQRIPPRRLEV